MTEYLKEFFDLLFDQKTPEEFIEFRFFRSDKTPVDHVWLTTVDEAVSYVEKNSEGKNCYYGIHPRSVKKGTQDAVSSFSTLYIDVDFEKVEEDLIRKRISAFGIPPTLLVNTGHGFQIYYKLRNTYAWEELKPVLLRLIRYYKADELKNKDRVFRIVSTTNIKRKPWTPCEILSFTTKKYSLEEVKTVLNKHQIALEDALETPGPIKLPEEFSLLGFKRKENRWESGICPKCGNAGLFIYDNNPKVVICSHSGSCNFTSSVTELRDIVLRQRKRSGAAFAPKEFIASVKNQPPALKIGYPRLDKIYKFRLGTFNLIAARLGVGKSTFAYNMLLNCAEAYPESNFIFFTYEVPKDLLYIRLLTIEYAKASKQSVSFDEMTQEIKTGGHKAALAIKRLERLNNILIFDSPSTTVNELQKIVLDVPNVGCVWVDYLEKVKVEGASNNEELRVSSISTSLTNFAIEQKQFPIIVLSQINREVKGRLDPRPTESDVRYSDRPAADSTIMFGLYNPSQNKKLGSKKNSEEEDITPEDSEEEETKPITKLEVLALKNRFGKRGREVMLFDQVSGLVSQLKREIPVRPIPVETPKRTNVPSREIHLHKPLTYKVVE